MTNQSLSIRNLVAAALLAAIGIAIPMFSPIKIVIGPASFTLASHVPIFIAMFLSPAVALAVSLVTTLGFFLGGFPIVIVARALTHVVFATLGALFLRRRPQTLRSTAQWLGFASVVSVVHALMEVLVVIPFYAGGSLSEISYTTGFFVTVVVLVGVGSFIHSMVDFAISVWVYRAVAASRGEMKPAHE